MISHWVEHATVLRGDRAKVVKGKRAAAIDRGDESTALVVQVCESPMDAQRYLKHIEQVWNQNSD